MNNWRNKRRGYGVVDSADSDGEAAEAGGNDVEMQSSSAAVDAMPMADDSHVRAPDGELSDEGDGDDDGMVHSRRRGAAGASSALSSSVAQSDAARWAWSTRRLLVCLAVFGAILGMMWLSAHEPPDDMVRAPPTLKQVWENVVAVGLNASMASLQVAETTLRTKRHDWPNIVIVPAQVTAELPATTAFFDDELKPLLARQSMIIIAENGHDECVSFHTEEGNVTAADTPAIAEKRNETVTNATLIHMAIKIEQYRARFGAYPASLKDSRLVLPVDSPDLADDKCVVPSLCRWVLDKAFMSSEASFVDGWNREWHYSASADGQSFRLFSLGADGVAGTKDDIGVDDAGVQFYMSLIWSQQFNLHHLNLKYKDDKLLETLYVESNVPCVSSDLSPEAVNRMFAESGATLDDMQVDPERDRLSHQLQFWVNVTEYVAQVSKGWKVEEQEQMWEAVGRLVSLIHMYEFQNMDMPVLPKMSKLDDERNRLVVNDFVHVVERYNLTSQHSVAVLVPATRVRRLEELLTRTYGYVFAPESNVVPPKYRLREAIDVDKIDDESAERARRTRWLTKYDVWFDKERITEDIKETLRLLVWDELRLL